MKSTRIPKTSLRGSLRPLVAALVSVLLFGASGFTQAEHVNKKGKPFPKVKLPKVAKGLDIFTALGANAAAVADWYGLTPEQLKKLAKEEKSLRADKKGQLHNICGLLPPAAPTSDDVSGTVVSAPYPLEKTFYLHSRPGCSKVIYLDFNGHTSTGTDWSASYTDGGSIVTPLYDTDGNPATFSSQELANIQVIWQRVSEDFAPFEVDVTTEDPGSDAVRKATPNSASFGKRVCIGGSCSDWLGQSAGGVAYIGSFGWEIDTPVYVFPAQLGKGNPTFVAKAASHELGHAFGMHHQGTTAGSEYYAGNADWAPIMGLGYYANLSQWAKGEYTGANNTEDQMALIASYLGYRPNAAGTSMATAAPLTGSPLSATGLILNASDVDVYRIDILDGTYAFKLSPLLQFGSVFGRVTLYDSSGNAKWTAAPVATTSRDVAFNVHLSRGTYYVGVNGAGLGSPSGWGFSSYGSIGHYQLSVAATTDPASQAPTAQTNQTSPLKVPTGVPVNFSSAGSSDPGGNIAGYMWNFADGSTGSNQPNPAYAYKATGTYNATLTVSNNAGYSNSKSVAIYVCAANALSASGITMKLAISPTNYMATAIVNVTDAYGKARPGATVTGEWSGPVSLRGATATADSTGACTFNGPSSPLAGAYTFKITGIALASYVYDPQMNTISQEMIYTPEWAANAIDVASITMRATVASNIYSATSTAIVNVRNVYGKPVVGATVTGDWSGLASARGATGTTDSLGSCIITSPASLSPSGTFDFKVTGITLIGFAYDSHRNAITSASIAPPPDAVGVSAISLSAGYTSGKFTTKATVSVKDAFGTPVSGIKVAGNWSGPVSATGASATTDAEGVCVLTSPSTATRGNFTFTVTGMSLLGYAYNPVLNAATSASMVPPPVLLKVSGIAMKTAFASGQFSASATVAVKDSYGNPVSRATVKGDWSGAVIASSQTATTDDNGNCVLTSTSTSTRATFTFTVTGVVLTGFPYDLSLNTVTTASILPAPKVTSVSAITMSTAFAAGKFTAKTTVNVRDLDGNPVSGATVTGNWSGAVSATGKSATTDAAGNCVLVSNSTATRSPFTFTVTGISLRGYGYDPLRNTVSTASITPSEQWVNASAITMSTAFASGKYTAKATVNVKDPAGNPLSGAVVKGNWSGAVSAIGVTATTSTTGICALTSASTVPPGNFTFTITSITLPGYTYDLLKNVVTEASITPPPNEVNIHAITMTTTLSSGKYTTKATITVKDLSGNPRSGAAVKGNWSGAVNATGVSANTGSTGTCVFTSPTTTTKGTFTFTVSGITLTSFTYDPVKNVLTSNSITPP